MSAILTEYRHRGWALVPIPAGQKGPVARRWQSRRFDPTDFPPGCNVGVILGPRSGELVDIDLDCRESLDLADLYLPPTGAAFGRASKPRSHRLYISAGSAFEAFRDPLTGDTLLELRAGDGHQTIFPPSVADNEPRRWHGDIITPTECDVAALRLAAAWLAIGCLVWRYLGEWTARRPAPDFPALLWEFDNELAAPAYAWLGWPRPDAPQRYPRPRRDQDPRDLDLAEIVKAIPNNCDWEGWNNIGLAIFTASKDGGDGFVIFDAFSAKSPKYDPYATIARWILARADEVIE